MFSWLKNLFKKKNVCEETNCLELSKQESIDNQIKIVVCTVAKNFNLKITDEHSNKIRSIVFKTYSEEEIINNSLHEIIRCVNRKYFDYFYNHKFCYDNERKEYIDTKEYIDCYREALRVIDELFENPTDIFCEIENEIQDGTRKPNEIYCLLCTSCLHLKKINVVCLKESDQLIKHRTIIPATFQESYPLKETYEKHICKGYEQC